MKHEEGFRRVTVALSVVVFVVLLLPLWHMDYGIEGPRGWLTRTMYNVPLALLIGDEFTQWFWSEWSYAALGAVCLVISGLCALIPWAGFYGIRWVVGGFSGEDK